ncbi:unnamed protein product [Paramecium octaurelia]|uniref:Uncharacterized protein n=1 Tax=Paramecium octaurelia TaxID=43137 RepID=A0A8S1T7I8_PAROT|nr:unnamed protein product [Paramecium octaurelia]
MCTLGCYLQKISEDYILVTQPINNIIYYISDDRSIMRSEKIRNQEFQQSEILTNVEHIKHLKWIGEDGNNLLKLEGGQPYGKEKQQLVQEEYTQRMEINKENGINYSKISPTD